STARRRYRPDTPYIEPLVPVTQGMESAGVPAMTPLVRPALPRPFTPPPATHIKPASAWSVPLLEFCTVVRPNSLSVTTTRLFQSTLSDSAEEKYFRSA